MMLEAFGYFASLVIAISLSMKSLVKLRSINLVGGMCFAIYGFFIGSLPVIILNSTLCLMNIFHLFKIYRKNEDFKLLKNDNLVNPYLIEFLDFYKEDISKFFEPFDLSKLQSPLIIYTLRDMVTAGLFIGEIHETDGGKKEIRIVVDYVTPAFRDFKCSTFFYANVKELADDHDIEHFVIQTANKLHTPYLVRTGFKSLSPSMYSLEC